MTTRRDFLRGAGIVAAVPALAVAKVVGASAPAPKYKPIMRHEPLSSARLNELLFPLHEKVWSIT